MTQLAELSHRAFLTEVLENKATRVILFSRPSDVRCLVMKVKLDELAAEFEGTSFCRVDISKYSDTASLCNLLAIPVVLIFKGGRIVARADGMQTRKSLFDKLGPWLKE